MLEEMPLFFEIKFENLIEMPDEFKFGICKENDMDYLVIQQ